jgi:hypothetical protein
MLTMNFLRKKSIPFTTASKKFKNLQINLTKKMKDLYMENFKTLTKKVIKTLEY